MNIWFPIHIQCLVSKIEYTFFSSSRSLISSAPLIWTVLKLEKRKQTVQIHVAEKSCFWQFIEFCILEKPNHTELVLSSILSTTYLLH